MDPDTGLYYFNARWVDPNMGRFIIEDPIKDGNNWHIYAYNNPLRFIDPTGLANIESDSVVGNTTYDTDTGSLKSTDADEDDEKEKKKSKTSSPKKKELTEEEKLSLLINEVIGSMFEGVNTEWNDINIVYRPETPAEIIAAMSGIDFSQPPTSLTPAQQAAMLSSRSNNTGSPTGTSLPNNTIYMPNGTSTIENKAVLVHEAFHQMQYELHGKKEGFHMLVGDKIQKLDSSTPSPYRWENSHNLKSGVTQNSITKIRDIKTLEGQAQFVEDFANDYLKSKSSGTYSPETIHKANVLKESGMMSTAIKGVLGL